MNDQIKFHKISNHITTIYSRQMKNYQNNIINNHHDHQKILKKYQQYQHQDINTIKLNQSLPPQTNFIIFLLILLSLLSNATHGYDYNVVIGCGIYFLSTKHPLLHKMGYFYILVVLTICADGLVIALLWEKVDILHALIIPGIQIALKLILLIIQTLYWRKQSQQQKQTLIRKSLQNTQFLKEIQQQKAHQVQKMKYLQQKQQLKSKPGDYYISKNTNYNINRQQQAYKSQLYKQFDRQQFITDTQQNESTYIRKN